MMNEWLKDNVWNIVVTAVGVIIAFATLGARVEAIENDHIRLTTSIDRLTEVTERLIIVEERQQGIREDITEIKADVKDLKKHFEVE